MDLVVVAVDAEHADDVTLGEWDLLQASPTVWFEHTEHPLQRRLQESGVETLVLDARVPDRGGIVCDPTSPRLVELARLGATVTAGIAAPPDGLTAAHAAPILRRGAASLADAVAVMARLRSADGCPWDLEQDHASLRVHLLEEAYEVLEAIDEGATGPRLQDELGDLLLQVLFHAQMAADAGTFDISGVAGNLVAKLVRRHPHVFGEVAVSGADEVVSNWEQIKAGEKAARGEAAAADLWADIPKGLPALATAAKVTKRAARSGWAPDADRARAEVAAAIARPPSDETVGDALMALTIVARSAGVDPEGALRTALRRFAAERAE